MRLACVCLILIGALVGCDREKPAPPPPKPPPVMGVDISRVTPLPPDRRTHITVSGGGQIFWVQEADGGRETVFSLSEGDLPSATRLSNAAVLEALSKSDGRGSLQSLVAAPDGKLYFYFSGRSGRDFIAALGSFAPASGRIQILEQADALGGDSRLGGSLALARGSLVTAGDLLWLWLRHESGYALLSLNITHSGSVMRQTFEKVHSDQSDLQMTSQYEDLTTGPGKSLLYLDRHEMRIWRIESLGEATALADVSDLPATTTAPSVDDQNRLVLFAPSPAPKPEDSDSLTASLVASTRPGIAFPALVILDATQRTLFDRKTFTAPASVNIKSLAPATLTRDRAGWLAYNHQTGELLRLRITQR